MKMFLIGFIVGNITMPLVGVLLDRFVHYKWMHSREREEYLKLFPKR